MALTSYEAIFFGEKMVRLLTLMVSLFFSIQMTGCASNSTGSGPPSVSGGENLNKSIHQPTPTPEPKSFTVRLTVSNWLIKQHTIIDDPMGELSGIRYVGRYLYGKDVVFQFKSTRFPEHFWLANMPPERDGVFEVSAQVKRTPCSDCNLLGDNGTPPQVLSMVVLIQKGKILNHYIINPLPWWGKFHFDAIDRKKQILYIRNNKYQGEKWSALYAKENGEATLTFHLQK
jgi:hypothetical protein